MYLKSIEMYGFKSFAERTKIELNDNITCIVGPNGSGKSNITDAIKWVLGEQSSSVLRGSKMADVIFTGTSNRRALGMSEVIITFDNSTHFLDIDYSEVEVKRRLYKNGDSEYYINNNPCRLKDVRELFMDTGIGRDGYSIIGQGKIDQILNSKPVERRAIFEEASGISKFKSQKTDIERKLKNTNENLLRLSDLLVEIESQKNSLEKEAKLAKKYYELFYEIKNADIILSTNDLININNKTLDLNEEKLEKQDIKDKLVIESDNLSEDFENIKKNLEDIEFKINELQAINVENIRNERDLSSSISINQEKIDSRDRELNDLRARLEIREDELISLKSELTESDNNLKSLISDKESIEKNTTSLEESLNKHLESFNEINKELLEIDNQISILNDNISKAQIRINTLEYLNKEREESKENINAQFSRLKLNQDEVNELMEKLDSDLDASEKTNKELELSVINETKTLKDVKEEINRVKDNISKLLSEKNSKTTRLSTLENMESTYEGYNNSVKNFFRKIKRDNIAFSELHDTVANILSVEPIYEKAITTALGASTQNLIVDTFKSAQKMIDFLRNENLGRITFLPLDSIKVFNKQKPINKTGFIGYASKLVSFDPKYGKIVDFLLGNIAIVDNLDNAKLISETEIKNMRIVTLDGDVINPGGSVSGGSINIKGGIISRKNEISKLKTTLENIENNINISRKNENILLEKVNSIEKSLEDLNNQIYIITNEKNKLQNRKVELSLSKENNINNINNFKNQILSYEDQILTTNNEINDLISNKEIAENKLKLILEEKSKFNDSLESKNKDKENLNNLLSVENLKIANINSEISFINKNNERTKGNIQNTENEIEKLQNTLSNYSNEIETLFKENEEKAEELKELIEINSKYDSNHKSLNENRKEVLNGYDEISRKINDKKSEILDLEKEIYLIGSKIENNTEKTSSIIQYISEKYSYNMVIIDEKMELRKSPINKTTINKLKQDINNLGNVNLGAIKSFKEVKERFEFITDQYNDLINSETKLKSLLSEIEQTMEEKFLESLKEINDNFGRIFTYMFGGGEAELVLNEGETLDETGIDIIAKLPGKRKQLLDAMSGGERSMTTVSLLFALLETRPAPFCLLDEVDAALDEANIRRFLSYLKNLEDIQFAIITHRKTTMAAADYLYGVTMEEPGVSKVVSLKFDGRNKNVQMV